MGAGGLRDAEPLGELRRFPERHPTRHRAVVGTKDGSMGGGGLRDAEPLGELRRRRTVTPASDDLH